MLTVACPALLLASFVLPVRASQLVNHVLGNQSVGPNIITVVRGFGKVFVGEIVEKGKLGSLHAVPSTWLSSGFPCARTRRCSPLASREWHSARRRAHAPSGRRGTGLQPPGQRFADPIFVSLSRVQPVRWRTTMERSHLMTCARRTGCISLSTSALARLGARCSQSSRCNALVKTTAFLLSRFPKFADYCF